MRHPVPSGAAGAEPASMTAPSDDGAARWLLLAYRLPDKPASLRAVVRRKLSAAGAVYLAAACAAAPLSAPAERVMRQMSATITGAGGSAVLLAGRAVAGQSELTGAFNGVRDLEYEDIIAGCREAAAGLETLTAAREFRYQPLWDGDIGLRQLSARYRAVRGRDRFGARQADAAAAALDQYRCALGQYAAHVYATDSRS